ncbi:MAG: hypothetical protein HY360_01025 [Verrucomicrobia bacterium]|nr:hypothetical protein [Verrucomicrobiota bacterium]
MAHEADYHNPVRFANANPLEKRVGADDKILGDLAVGGFAEAALCPIGVTDPAYSLRRNQEFCRAPNVWGS